MKNVLSCFFLVFISSIALHAQTVDSTRRSSFLPNTITGVNEIDSGSSNNLHKSFMSIASSKLTGKLKSSLGIFQKMKKKPEFHARVFNETNYVNVSNDPSSYNGIYTRTGIAPTLKILGIPLSGELSIATQNSQVRFDYSTASMQFDMPQYKSQVKESYLKYIGDLNHFFSADEATAVSKISDTVKRMQDCEKLISSPNYDKDLNSLIGQAKSMEDSSKQHPLDSTKANNYKT